MDYHKYTLRHILLCILHQYRCIATWYIDSIFTQKNTYIILVILIKINMKSTTNYRHWWSYIVHFCAISSMKCLGKIPFPFLLVVSLLFFFHEFLFFYIFLMFMFCCFLLLMLLLFCFFCELLGGNEEQKKKVFIFKHLQMLYFFVLHKESFQEIYRKF